ncbi:BlaI/MecI/CopY family transcriptional regulator [Allobranchiibius sp. CTAmp26]|uniref:BlaI/MecI/CopY family transcriptional regulator n=1 Tax=Allobranchiibius sp. CTAmp26 TaxID=2815214 RepID=UPI001AA131C9|nr:BlaI/MecI/CopY family transcriptional regulator [Allobranchiibius sp. CTAmp26]MBO1753806.1 BlaI/MecI/CopY family transcriptional regulator [Allobranchiibius sp. CTAmp26]
MRRQPGALEREVVAAIAAAGEELTTPQIHAALARPLAYTTVMTTLARLCDKGVLRRAPAGRTYRYGLVESTATMGAALAAHQMRRLMDSHEDRSAVMSRFIGDLSADDARLLAQLLTEATGAPQADEPGGQP